MKKKFLFVDDDPRFLAMVREVFSGLAKGTWEIHLAENHAKALSLLGREQMDLVVLDIGMPVMDGVQFLQLLGRTHPGLKVVMLTGAATEQKRQACLAAGAALFLEKVITPEGFQAVFATLDALASAQPQAGFQGMMRRVGLQEVLQMECLGTKSSILEIFTGKVRGRIFICDGAIVHAESGALEGEIALYSLLALRGGQFNLLHFSEPARRTISGQWEFLLMEAARLNDEKQQSAAESPVESEGTAPAEIAMAPGPGGVRALGESPVRIEEILLCTGSGELLYAWECKAVEGRMQLFEEIEREARALSTVAPLGRFDRLEITTNEGRIVCQIQPDRRMLVRSSSTGNGER